MVLNKQLFAKDVVLSPVPGSHMDRIVNSIASVDHNCLNVKSDISGEETNNTGDPFDDEEISRIIVNMSEDADSFLEMSHARSMAVAVENLAEKGEEVIKFVRGEVIPTLSTLVNRVVDEMKIKKQEGVRKYSVVPYRPADIFFSESIQEIISNASPRHNVWGIKNEFKVCRWFAPMPLEDLFVIMKTDHPGLNALIENAIQFYGDDVVQNAYDIFFNAAPPVDRAVFYPSELRSDQKFEGERLFAILLAMGLRDHPPTGVNISLGDVHAYLSDVVAFNGSSLFRFMKNYATRAEKKFLDVHRKEFNTVDACFYVNDVAHDYWKSKGLTDEAILGSLVSEGTRDAEKIMAKKEFYEGEWRRHQVITNRAIEANTETAIHQAIRTVVHTHAKSVFGDTYLAESGRIDKKINDVFASGYKPHKDDDIYRALREVVLCIFYPDESVCVMLKSLDDILVDNPGMDPRQAAGLAFIDLAVSWMLSQVSVD